MARTSQRFVTYTLDLRLRMAAQNLAGNLFGGHHPEEALAFGHCRIDKTWPNVSYDDFSASLESLFAQRFHIVDLIGFRRAVGRCHRFTTQSPSRGDGNEMSVRLLLKQMEKRVNDVCPTHHVGVSVERSLPIPDVAPMMMMFISLC